MCKALSLNPTLPPPIFFFNQGYKKKIKIYNLVNTCQSQWNKNYIGKFKYFKTKFFPSQIILQAPTPPLGTFVLFFIYFCLFKTVSHKVAQAQATLKSVILLP